MREARISTGNLHQASSRIWNSSVQKTDTGYCLGQGHAKVDAKVKRIGELVG